MIRVILLVALIAICLAGCMNKGFQYDADNYFGTALPNDVTPAN